MAAKYCTKESPFKEENHNDGDQWRHSATEEIGDQIDGHPGGDLIRIRCKNCGVIWTEELPQ